LLAQSNWLFVEANKKKGSSNPRPEPLQRPYNRPPQQQQQQPLQQRAGRAAPRPHATLDEMKKFFGKG